MNCPQCGSGHTSVEFDDAGLIDTCVECDARWKHVDADHGQALAPPDVAPAKRSHVTPPASPRLAPTKPVNPKTLLQQARARVTELDREIKKLTRLVQERDELKRLLSAAKTSGETANVRPIRAASRG